MNAGDILRKEFHGQRNFMTPKFLKNGLIKTNRAYELSSGRGLYDQPIFGVSIVDYDPITSTTARNDDLSELFQSLGDAQAYIERLKQKS